MPLGKQQSVISFDPIAQKKQLGMIGRLLITRWYKGKRVVKSEPYGHYMFCGSQGSGKTSSSLWYAEQLAKKYSKKKITYTDHTKCDEDHLKCKITKFKTAPKVKLYSNFGVGRHFDRAKLFETVNNFEVEVNEVRVVLIDEVQTYFPKGSVNKETKEIQDKMIAIFSQLRKRNTFILSTAQVYGRLDKSLREQCLFMIACRVNVNSKLVCDFIPGDDIICDDLGRWAGKPKWIKVHGLPTIKYDTKKIIRE